MHDPPPTSNSDYIVKIAQQQFIEQGYQNTTIEAICTAANITKNDFHLFFEDKVALTFAVTTALFDYYHGKYAQSFESNIPFTAKLEEVLAIQIAASKDNTFKFVYYLKRHGPESIQDLIEEKSAENTTLLLHHFEQAQKDGDLRKDIRIDFMLFMLFELVDILDKPSLQAMYNSPEEAWVEILKYHFYGSVGKKV